MDEKYELITLFDEPMLYTDWRIPDSEVPKGLYKYEIRHDDDQKGDMAEVCNHIWVNFMGTVLSKKPIEDKKIGEDVYDTIEGIPIELDDYNYTGDVVTVDEYLRNYCSLSLSGLEAAGVLVEEEENIADYDEKLKACTTACSLINLLDSINDAEFVDEVISCISSNDAFSLGQLAAQFTGKNHEYDEYDEEDE